MKKTLNKRVSALAVSMFIMTAPMALGTNSLVPGEKPERTEIMPAITVRQKPMMLAENEKDTAGQKSPTASGTKGPASETESGPETDNKEPSIKSKATALKPFKPSEEIAAEQAVDFPVDI
jgi:hypothetical protein